MRYVLTIDVITDLTEKELDDKIEETLMRDEYILGGEALVHIERVT
jgi:hypothetical protein